MGKDFFDINIETKKYNENTNKTFDAIHTISEEVKNAETEINKLNHIQKHYDDKNKFDINLQSHYDLSKVSIPLNNIYTTSGKALNRNANTIITIDDDILPDTSGFENTIRKQRKTIDELLENNEELKKNLQASKDRIIQLEGENKKLIGEKKELENQLARNQELLRENEAELFRKLRNFLTQIGHITKGYTVREHALNLRRDGNEYLSNMRNYLDVCANILARQIERNNQESENDKKEIEKLKQQKVVLERNIAGRRVRIYNLFTELNTTKATYKRNREIDGALIGNLAAAIQQKEIDYNNLNAQLTDQQTLVAQVQGQLAVANNQNAALQIDNAALVVQRNNLQAQLTARLQDINNLQGRIRRFGAQVAILIAGNGVLQGQIVNLNTQVAELIRDNLNLHGRLNNEEALQFQVEILSELRDELQGQNAGLQGLNAGLHEQVAYLNTQVAELIRNNLNLHGRLNNEDVLQFQVQILSELRDELQANNQQLNLDVAGLQGQNAGLHEQVAYLNTQVAEIIRNNLNLHGRLNNEDVLQFQVEIFTQIINELNNQIAAKDATIALQTGQNAVLQGQNADLHAQIVEKDRLIDDLATHAAELRAYVALKEVNIALLEEYALEIDNILTDKTLDIQRKNFLLRYKDAIIEGKNDQNILKQQIIDDLEIDIQNLQRRIIELTNSNDRLIDWVADRDRAIVIKNNIIALRDATIAIRDNTILGLNAQIDRLINERDILNRELLAKNEDLKQILINDEVKEYQLSIKNEIIEDEKNKNRLAQARNVTLQRRIRNLITQRSVLRDIIRKRGGDIKARDNTINELITERDYAIAQCAQLSAEVDTKNNTIALLGAENRDLKKRLNESNHACEDLRRIQNIIRKEKLDLIRSLGIKDNEIRDLNKRLRESNNTNVQLIAQHYTLNEEKKQLNNQIVAKDATLMANATQLTNNGNRILELETELELTKRQNVGLWEIHKISSKDYKKFEERYRETLLELEQKNTDNLELERRINNLQRQLLEGKRNNEQLIRERDEARLITERKQTEIGIIANEIKTTGANIYTLKGRIVRLTNDLKAMLQTVEDRGRALIQSNQTNTQLEQEIKTMRERFEEGKGALNLQVIQIATLRDELIIGNQVLQKKNTENAELQRQLQEEGQKLESERKNSAEQESKNFTVYRIILMNRKREIAKLSRKLVLKNNLLRYLGEQCQKNLYQIMEFYENQKKLNEELIKQKGYVTRLIEINIKTKKSNQDKDAEIERQKSKIEELERALLTSRTEQKSKDEYLTQIILNIQQINKMDDSDEKKGMKYEGNDVPSDLKEIDAQIQALMEKIENMTPNVSVEKMREEAFEIEERHRRNLSVMQNNIDTQNARIQELEKEKDANEVNKLALEEGRRNVNEIGRLTEEIERQKDILKDFEENKRQLKINNIFIIGLTQSILHLQSENARLKTGNDVLNKQLENKNETDKKNIDLTRKLLMSKFIIKCLLESKNKLKNGMESQIRELEQKKIVLEQEDSKNKLTIAQQSAEIERLQRENLQSQENKRAIEQQLTDIHYQNRNIFQLMDVKHSKDFKGLSDDFKNLTHKINLLTEENKNLKQTNEENGAQLLSDYKEIQRINEVNEKLKAENGKLKSEKKDLEVIIMENNAEIKEKDALIEEQKKSFSILNTKYRSETQKLSEYISSLQNDNIDLSQQLQKIRDKTAKTKQTEHEIEQMYNQNLSDQGDENCKNLIIEMYNNRLDEIKVDQTYFNDIIRIFRNNNFEQLFEQLNINSEDFMESEVIPHVLKKLPLFNIKTKLGLLFTTGNNKIKILLSNILKILTKHSILFKYCYVSTDIELIRKLVSDINVNLIEKYLFHIISTLYKKIREKYKKLETEEDILEILNENKRVYQQHLDDIPFNYELDISFIGKFLRLIYGIYNKKYISYINNSKRVADSQIIDNVQRLIGVKLYEPDDTSDNNFYTIIKIEKELEDILQIDNLKEVMSEINDSKTGKLPDELGIQDTIPTTGGGIADTLFLMFFNKYVCVLIILLLVLLYFYVKCQRQKTNYRKSYRNYLLTINQN